jgi:thiol-disulfide isomerase/thioredoxin
MAILNIIKSLILSLLLKFKNMFTEIEQDNLAEVVASNDTVVVQYSATWCGNCRIMKPKFKMLASQNESIPFLMVDAEKFPESRKLATVDNLPTFATFKNGKLVNQTQTNKLEVLTELVNEVI